MMNGFHLSAERAKERQGSRGTMASRDSISPFRRPDTPLGTVQPLEQQNRTPRKLVLCFDGTGNKFRGDDSDSNILKIFRCLDREAGDQCRLSSRLCPFSPDPRMRLCY
jgi:hypothetical protein